MLKALRENMAWIRKTRQALSERLWDKVDRFDRECSNDWELWEALPEEAQQLYREAKVTFRQDKAAGLTRLEEAAALGNSLAMVQAGRCYWHGTGTAADRDKAERFITEARNAGSWHAAIELARLAARRGEMGRCFAILEEGARADYTAAMFWLAWYRYRETPGRRTARAIRPLLETAVKREHPGARWLMARLLIRGRFGLIRIGEGWRMNEALRTELEEEANEEAAPQQAA